ncbi:MAG: hypothetical protein BWK78_05955 [Thiotrichaceae bacterium IS1]|nr:MAG: hypothetical protein BWK78_05955 [Thiotrichaceae bacterium IS1]
MNTIQTNAVISSTGELTIKLPSEIAPVGTSVVVLVVCPQVNSMETQKVPTLTDTPNPEWGQEYLNHVLGGWLGSPPQRPDPLTWEERHLW